MVHAHITRYEDDVGLESPNPRTEWVNVQSADEAFDDGFHEYKV
jgi:hypothetical protein